MTRYKPYTVYLLIFSFLLSGCYTTENYTDTPRDFLTGKSEVKPTDDYKIDSLLLSNNSILNLSGYYSRFIDYRNENTGKLVYIYLSSLSDTSLVKGFETTSLYKKYSHDTVGIKDISRIYYNQKKFDYVGTSFLVMGITASIVVLFFLAFLNSMPKHGFGK